MTKLIIFDIGGVIEDYAETQYIDYICAKLHLDKKRFADEMLRILPSAEEGKISTGNMLRKLAVSFEVSVRSLEWQGFMARTARINRDVAALVGKLRRRYRVIMLTNVSKSRYMDNVKIGFFRKVRCDRVYASCYLGMSKPGQQIYRYVLREEKVNPKDAIFIDNMAFNVKGAQSVGIKGIHFVGYGKLVKDLRKLGIRW